MRYISISPRLNKQEATKCCQKPRKGVLMEGSLQKYAELFDQKNYKVLNEELSYAEYIELLKSKPKLARNAFQYMYDMIMSKGTSEFTRYRKKHTRYNFFSESHEPVYGLEETIENLVNWISGAAGGYGAEKRVLLLHGPVGSSKSTICRNLKRGLEDYSKTDEGAWYTWKWKNLPTKDDALGKAIYTDSECECVMNEDPIKLMDLNMRREFLKELNDTHVEMTSEDERVSLYELVNDSELNPRCKMFMSMLLKRYNGDWLKVVTEHIVVVRKVHSEVDRIGIGTFQPKDEKNQDSTELSGDLNYNKIGHFGKDSDARAFNFDGEFQVANRGMCEFIEMLKLAKEFLYDLLGASQEHSIKPKKFSQITIDQVIIAHTNNPEYEKLKNDKTMEALRDRTTKIDVPYQLRWSDEIKILTKDYGPGKVKQHIMPHTIDIAAFWAILTRLEDDGGDDRLDKLELRDKVKLYDGQKIPGWTEDSVKELKDKHPEEGMIKGISPRYVQDKISNCLAKHKKYVNVFHVLNEIKEGLGNSSLITDVNDRKRYEVCVELAVKELDDILKNEVQRALGADEKALERLCNKYLDNVVAYVNDEKIEDPITHKMVEADERLMRSVEEKCDITQGGSRDFRRSISSFIGTMSRRGEEFRWDSNAELRRALEKKVFEDLRDTIKIATLTKEVAELDPEVQEKIDAVKTRLIRQHGYNEQSATDVLEYVSSIFARGDSKD